MRGQMLKTLVGCVMVLTLIEASACVPRSLARAGRSASRLSRSNSTPKDLVIPPFPVYPMNKKDTDELTDARTRRDQLFEKYELSGDITREPILMTQLLDAWRNDSNNIEKPKDETLQIVLGCMLGDYLKAHCPALAWKLTEDDLTVLATENGMTVVSIFEISNSWVFEGKKPSVVELENNVKQAITTPGKDPAYFDDITKLDLRKMLDELDK